LCLTGELLDYFKYVKTLKYSEKPDYDYVRNLFAMALQKRGHNSDGVFDWVSASHVQRSPQMRKKSGRKVKLKPASQPEDGALSPGSLRHNKVTKIKPSATIPGRRLPTTRPRRKLAVARQK
jgi:hypothetical protein